MINLAFSVFMIGLTMAVSFSLLENGKYKSFTLSKFTPSKFYMNLNDKTRFSSKFISQLVLKTSFSLLLPVSLQLAAPNLNVMTLVYPAPAYAAVGEGDLPAGSMAFSKILKYKKDWAKLIDAINARKKEMGKEEVFNMKYFMKEFANEYGDMDLLIRSINDPTKAEKAKEVIRDFRKLMRECDNAASDNDLDKILDIYPRTVVALDTFFDLLHDVPDEL